MLRNFIQKFTKRQHTKSANTLSMIPFNSHGEQNIDPNCYINNPVIHKCINLIATSASHVPWQVFSQKGGKLRLQSNHPALLLLKKPNSESSGADFFTENLSNMMLYGNSYMLISPNRHNKEIELRNVHPSSIRPMENSGQIVGYKITDNNRIIDYSIDPIKKTSQILHLKNYHPKQRSQGISSINAASDAIRIYSKIIEWNKSLLKNATKPSGTLVFQDSNGYLTDEQFSRLQEQFYENYSGSYNSGKPLILEGGLKWQDISVSEKFEKFIELKDSVSRDIAMAFNVPPQLLGINGDNTYSNMQEARLALWEENIIPLLDKYADSLGNWLSHWYQEELVIDFDKEAISILTERRESVWAKIASADFMTINEKRKHAGLPPIKNGDNL